MSKKFKMTYHNGRTRIAINIEPGKDRVYNLQQYRLSKKNICSNCNEKLTHTYGHFIEVSTYKVWFRSNSVHKTLPLCNECALKLNLHFRCRKKKDIIKGLGLLKMKGVL